MREPFHTMGNQILVFTLDEQSYALFLPAVIKVIHAIEIRHLPKAPEIISGIINIKGQIIPVADIRKRFGLATHEINTDDKLIITDTGKRQVAILVDSVNGIRDIEQGQLSATGETFAFAEHLKGVAKIDEDLILIYDLDTFLSLDEEKVTDLALKSKAG
jgi:purine-binding chemotaxis protein CheW